MRDAWPVIAVVSFAFIMFGGLGYVFYLDSKAERFSLKKADWICTQNKHTTIYIFNPALKVSMPHPQTECVQWVKIK